MSKGNRMIGVRVSDEEYQELLAQLAMTNKTTWGEPYTLSAWVRTAIREKLAKMARGRKPRKKKEETGG